MTSQLAPIAWMHRLRDDPAATRDRLLVLYSLAARLNATGVGHCSVQQLLADCGVGEKTARRALEWAQSVGYLERTRRGHRLGNGATVASEWRLCQPVTTAALNEPQPVTTDGLTTAQPVTTAALNERQPVKTATSTGQNGHLNRSPGPHQENYLQENINKSSSDSEQQLADRAHFDEFWQHYPRKVDKGHARKAYASAINRADHSVILSGVQRYAEQVRKSDTAARFIAHAATWLNGDRWEDEPGQQLEDDRPSLPWSPEPPPADIADDPVAYDRWVRERVAERRARKAASR